MDRLAIINYLIKKNNYKSFLNIGVFTGYTLDNVECEKKIGVDPDIGHYRGKEYVFPDTSDTFFSQLPENELFDCVFIDGMHLEEYVTRDIHNSLKHLSEEGVIILHDCNPPTPDHASRRPVLPEWNGDVYKAFVRFRGANPQYETYVIDTDWGCGVIRERRRQEVAGEQLAVIDNIDEIITPSEAEYFIKDWEFFDQNRAKALNIISVEEFIKKTNERIENHQLSAQ